MNALNNTTDKAPLDLSAKQSKVAQFSKMAGLSKTAALVTVAVLTISVLITGKAYITPASYTFDTVPSSMDASIEASLSKVLDDIKRVEEWNYKGAVRTSDNTTHVYVKLSLDSYEKKATKLLARTKKWCNNSVGDFYSAGADESIKLHLYYKENQKEHLIAC
ncbi:hypothetical protein [Flocculibacter collagenilyticus]|uniref:hypothetical protein n=1 Tax=Flocculibacter collagenilyticus TaxID=2744479 RepID=UPI0018F54E2E|nr:hypothetical protein [Flocculibacter collagenilyticus]